MKDLLIVLLLVFLLWGGYKGMTSLADYVKNMPETAVATIADAPVEPKKNVNKSAIEELKKTKQPEVVEPKKDTRTNGEKAMAAVRGQRLDAEGKLRSDDEFYQERALEKEKTPYDHPSQPARLNQPDVVKSPLVNESDEAEQQLAMAQKGKALAGEFTGKGPTEKKVFNIEKGEQEVVTKPKRAIPESYNAGASDGGKYAIIAGSFLNLDNARIEAERFKKLGYKNTSIIKLNDKNLIILNRFSQKASAKLTAQQVKQKGIDVYVKVL